LLDDEKKKLIEEEERYRHKIAAKLRSEAESIEKVTKDVEKSLWSKISEVLNSNFGLWFLSSVFISGGATVYQITQHHFQQKLSTQKELITCEFEIANRLNGMKYLLEKAKTYGDAQVALTPITKSFGAVSTEYENVNIAVLYFKTYQLTGIMNKKISNSVKELEQINLYIQAQNPKTALSAEDRNKLLTLIHVLQNDVNDHIDNKKL
jgi:hypothetical protein